ncbi:MULTISPECIES: hypothetical protein [unclassified Sphingomonas]|uniref:hypothetical protein n=1 Tax=unclassified Sphingomonas TaxID=196159 RepID=UPI0021519F20|nr:MULTISPECIES: hypothetical protein [unclassified Sphingomonas]MCR5871486.1 hypothetical protein [Sphingomonas sp. J344]UUY00218.1 hypothetical protein LRS08_03580 [Sphingomonas sp. J315]
MLAINAAAALPGAPRIDPAELRSAALSAPTPAHAQFRDPAAAIEAAAQRALKGPDHRDGDPPIPAQSAARTPLHAAPSVRFAPATPEIAPFARRGRPYQARAPPYSA